MKYKSLNRLSLQFKFIMIDFFCLLAQALNNLKFELQFDQFQFLLASFIQKLQSSLNYAT